MTMGEAIAKRIDELLIQKQWSLYRLSKESCLPLSTLKNLYYNHTKSPTLTVIFRIPETLDITPIEFLTSELFNPINIELY